MRLFFNGTYALTHFSGIRSLCKLQRKEGILTDSDYGGACGLVKGGEALKYVWRREGHALDGCQFFFANRAWVAVSRCGAATWVCG
ncbi:hypothetical protein RHGRI_021324 [Rhododendron griersonianum]|uniref:Uncharacterized protein n=1 Tax=Rhododendron griersonianum TaxID=479676 RepID=A0AAV6JL80_9ERIC|nr:hypothetical protein RHGRI_021324 [Rhododendron griersonianum]